MQLNSTFIFFLLSLIFSIDLTAQVIIKEKVEVNPNVLPTSIIFNGCYYDIYDESKIDELRFTPGEIEPGNSAIMKLWLHSFDYEYEYNEDINDIIQKTITIDPNVGTITKIGNGEYLFTASSEIPDDTTIIVTVNYENYNQSCVLFKVGIIDTNRSYKTTNCVDCSELGMPSGLSRDYGCGQIVIKNGDSLVVSTVPEIISAGDTSQIIIKRKLRNGTLVDYSPSQTFEVGMLDGCTLGKIHTEGMQDTNYFYGVTQPIYFIADSSADSGVVKLKVGLIIGGSNCGKDLNEKNNINKDAFAIKRKEGRNKPELKKMSSNAENEVCFYENFNSIIYQVANVVVGNECDRYPCNEVILRPNITYENFIDGTFGTTACIDIIPIRGTGVFQTVTEATFKSYNQYFDLNNITACYDINFNRWKFGHKLFLYPYFKVILDTCPNNAIQFGFKPISSIWEIKNRYHDSLKLCQAKIDLEGHRNYPNIIRDSGYVFMQVDYSHELAHGLDYKNLIDSLQNEFLYPALDSLQLGCFQISDIDQAKKIYKEELIRLLVGKTNINGDIIFSGLENRLSTGYKNHSEGSYLINGKLLSYEKYINNFPIVENTINVLMADFKNIWNCK